MFTSAVAFRQAACELAHLPAELCRVSLRAAQPTAFRAPSLVPLQDCVSIGLCMLLTQLPQGPYGHYLALSSPPIPTAPQPP